MKSQWRGECIISSLWIDALVCNFLNLLSPLRHRSLILFTVVTGSRPLADTPDADFQSRSETHAFHLIGFLLLYVGWALRKQLVSRFLITLLSYLSLFKVIQFGFWKCLTGWKISGKNKTSRQTWTVKHNKIKSLEGNAFSFRLEAKTNVYPVKRQELSYPTFKPTTNLQFWMTSDVLFFFK